MVTAMDCWLQWLLGWWLSKDATVAAMVAGVVKVAVPVE